MTKRGMHEFEDLVGRKVEPHRLRLTKKMQNRGPEERKRKAKGNNFDNRSGIKTGQCTTGIPTSGGNRRTEKEKGDARWTFSESIAKKNIRGG